MKAAALKDSGSYKVGVRVELTEGEKDRRSTTAR